MFKEIETEYTLRRKELQSKLSDVKSDLEKLSDPVTNHILASVNLVNFPQEVQQLHENQIRIEKESRIFKEESEKLRLQVDKWVTLYDQLNGAMKEVGDVVHWAGVIERDMQQVGAAITSLIK